jgi:hypothetical protein
MNSNQSQLFRGAVELVLAGRSAMSAREHPLDDPKVGHG